MQKIILVLFLTLYIQAQDLHDLVMLSYKNDPVIAQLNASVNLYETKTLSSDLWENPNLSLGITDIQIDNISHRSLEPMQTHFISIAQKIPLSDKLSLSKELSSLKEEIARLKVQDRKRVIQSKLTLLVYESVIMKRRLKLLQKNRRNFYRIKQLLQGYQADAEYIMEIEQVLSVLKIKEKTYLAKEEIFTKQIQELILQKPKDIEVKLDFVDLDTKLLKNHPLFALYQKDIQIAQKSIDLAVAKQKADIKVRAGYYQRQNRDDYINLSVSMPLQIRGREDIALKVAKVALSVQEHKAMALHNRFENSVKMLMITMDQNRATYRLYKQNILPKQKKISKYLRSKNSLNQVSMITLINNANKVIKYQDKALDALLAYFKAYAKMRYYL